jgi:hypothetical protein
MNEWKTLASRVTLFPIGTSSPPSALELYQKVWGQPDNFQKPSSALAPAVAQGTNGDVMVACSVHPMRVDFNFFAPFPSSIVEEERPPVLEDATHLRAELERIIGNVVCGGDLGILASRVAINAQFVLLCTNATESNKALISVMPKQYRMQITDEEDFIFQINRPQNHPDIQNVRMNYITKWSTDRIRLGSLFLPTNGSLTVPSTRREFIVASVTFDNNNVPVIQSLGNKEQSSLLYEGLNALVRIQHDLGLNVKGF